MFGFTVLELLIVIAVICAIAAIIIPNVIAARNKANLESCKSNLLMIQKSLELYYNDYQSYPPSGGVEAFLFLLYSNNYIPKYPLICPAAKGRPTIYYSCYNVGYSGVLPWYIQCISYDTYGDPKHSYHRVPGYPNPGVPTYFSISDFNDNRKGFYWYDLTTRNYAKLP